MATKDGFQARHVKQTKGHVKKAKAGNVLKFYSHNSVKFWSRNWHNSFGYPLKHFTCPIVQLFTVGAGFALRGAISTLYYVVVCAITNRCNPDEFGHPMLGYTPIQAHGDPAASCCNSSAILACGQHNQLTSEPNNLLIWIDVFLLSRGIFRFNNLFVRL